MTAHVQKLRTPSIVEAEPARQQSRGTSVSTWRRPLRPTIYVGLPLLLLLLLAAVGYPMVEEARRVAPQRFAPGKLVEFEKKEQALADARALMKSGKYAKSVAAYDAYLKKYPYSTAAKNGRATARAALEQSAPRAAKVASRKPAQSVDREKPSLRSRMRRIFRRPGQ